MLKLKEDLEEVIAYFADLVSLKKSEKTDDIVVVAQEIGVESTIAPAALNLIDKTCVLTTTKKNLQFGTIRGFGEIDSEVVDVAQHMSSEPSAHDSESVVVCPKARRIRLCELAETAFASYSWHHKSRHGSSGLIRRRWVIN